MSGDQLPSEDHVARYCKPTWVDGDLPTVAAFENHNDAPHISVNWLEFFGVVGREEQVAKVRQAFNFKSYTLRRNGRFVVVNVGAATERVKDTIKKGISFLHLPEDGDESHSGIFGYSSQDLAVALELRDLVSEADVFAAIPE